MVPDSKTDFMISVPMVATKRMPMQANAETLKDMKLAANKPRAVRMPSQAKRRNRKAL